MGNKVMMYEVVSVIAMPEVVTREGQPDIHITSAIVSASVEAMFKEKGVDLIATRVEAVTPIDTEADKDPPASRH